MSDFDTVLERVLTDQAFIAALAADPTTALAGYRLSAGEMDLLRSQVSLGAGADRQVETRTSKASLLGLLSPLEELAGRLADDAGIGHALGAVVAQHSDAATHIAGTGNAVTGHGGVHQGFGPAGGGTQVTGAAGTAQGLGAAPVQGFGTADPTQGFGPAGATQGFGAADPTQGFGPAGATQGFGTAGGPPGHGLADLPGQGPAQAPPAGYHPHVDVNGDGHWDRYTVERRADGGVDILADMNHDGRADFVGHDDNADGIIDSADYDHDFDGRFDTHMRDLNGDGWMDTREVDR